MSAGDNQFMNKLSVLATIGLELRHDCDGYWLGFHPPSGKVAHLNLDEICRGPVCGSVIREWSEYVLSNTPDETVSYHKAYKDALDAGLDTNAAHECALAEEHDVGRIT